MLDFYNQFKNQFKGKYFTIINNTKVNFFKKLFRWNGK